MTPIDDGRRFARAFPHARLVELDDTYTLIPIDQPARLAALLRELVVDGATVPAGDD
jgi:pimeloyl-ACP methyl ester carboxylesterase